MTTRLDGMESSLQAANDTVREKTIEANTMKETLEKVES